MLFNAWRVILVAMRKERGLSREQAAGRAGVSTSSWYRWENVGNGPSPRRIPDVAVGLGVSVDELLYRHAEVLLEHYRGRLLAAGTAHGVIRDHESPGSPEAVDHAGARTLGLQGHSLHHGPVWVDLNELMDKLPRLRPAIARPRRSRAASMPNVVRRPKKKRR